MQHICCMAEFICPQGPLFEPWIFCKMGSYTVSYKPDVPDLLL